MAVQRLFPCGDTLNRGARPGGGEWRNAEIWMGVMHARPGGERVGFERAQICKEVAQSSGVLHSHKVAGTVHMGLRCAFAHFHYASDHEGGELCKRIEWIQGFCRRRRGNL